MSIKFLTYFRNYSKLILDPVRSGNAGGGAMGRSKKCRKVCCLPQTTRFSPAGSKKKTAITMTVDEYETIRLLDKEGFSQDRCSEQMQISRTTVQAIYASARHKIALALVDGLTLCISGGDYALCDGKEDFCACGGCPRHRNLLLAQEELK